MDVSGIFVSLSGIDIPDNFDPGISISDINIGIFTGQIDWTKLSDCCPVFTE